MAKTKQEWEALGRDIQDIVDRAVTSHDFQKLNQSIRQAVDVGADAVRKAVDTAQKKAVPHSGEAKQGQVLTAQQVEALYGNTNGRTAKGIVKIVGGGLLTAVSLVLLLSSLVFDALVSGAVSLTVPIVMALASGSCGGLLIGDGVGNLNRIGRFKKYKKLLGQKTYCALEKLARTVGKTEKFVRKELLKMTEQGLFLEGHLDHEEKHFIVSDDTYRQFEQSRLQLAQRQQQAAMEAAAKPQSKHTPQVQEVLDRGDTYIAQIQACNDAIPGAVISQKISRIELLVQRIFDRAEAHPEIIPDLKKMMDYYLPMTVKLLKAYAEMDAQPVQGDTILNSKAEIEATLDTLNTAFEKLLDELFADTALDVSSDISVLNTLLAQEGLTDDSLTLPRK